MAAVDDATGTQSSSPETSQNRTPPTIMWSRRVEDPVPRSKSGCIIHSRWYVIEMKIQGSLQTITTKLTKWSKDADISKELFRNCTPNLILGTTIQSMNKGSFCYLVLKNVSDFSLRESFCSVLEDLQRQCQIDCSTGWIRWLTGGIEDMQFDVGWRGLAILLLGTLADQIRSSVRLTKPPWEETPETLLLNTALVLTEKDQLSALEVNTQTTGPCQNLQSPSKAPANHQAHQLDTVDMHTTTRTITIDSSEPDNDDRKLYTRSPELFSTYDSQGSCGCASSPDVTEHHTVTAPYNVTQRKELEVHSNTEEALPATMWSSATHDVIPKSKNGIEIHGRWYILQMLVHDRLETIVAEFTQWSRNSDLSTEFLRNWNPKLTFGITEDRSNQNHNYYLILKNVSNFNTRKGLLFLLERLYHEQRISLTYGWIRWLTGYKKNYQLHMCISSLEKLLMGTIRERNMASVTPMREPWQENQVALLLDEVLYTATDEGSPVLPTQERKRAAPWEELTQLAPGSERPVITRDADTKETQTETQTEMQTQEMEWKTAQLPIMTNEPTQSGSTWLKKTCQCGVGVDSPDEAKLCHECGRCERVKCSSCDRELPWNYKYCNMCGVELNTKDEPLLLTPPASASPASGRSVSQYTFVTPPASPAKGRFISHNTFVTPHTSTPTLLASVQASTSFQNYVQTSQFSQNASQSSEYSPFYAHISQLCENGAQTTTQSQFSAQVTQSKQKSQFCTNVSQPSQNVTQSSQSSQWLQRDQLRAEALQSIKAEVQFSQTHQADDQIPQTDQDSTIHNSASLSCSRAQHNAVNADINAQMDSSKEAKLLRKLQRNHYTDTDLHVAFTVTSSNPLTVQCSVCNETVQTGSFEQEFPDLQSHLSDTTHNLNLSKLEKKDAVNAIFEWIKGIYTDQFILKQHFAVCRYDQEKISLRSTADPYHRLLTHVNSKKHENNKRKRGNNRDISQYFTLTKIRRDQ